MKKALYRKQICAEKEKLTPEKVFHTPQYRDLLTSIGHEITGGKLTTLRLYDDKNSGIAGWNQGETVAVNLGNQITSSFLTLELKSDSLIGILGHECGHYRYTDSTLRKRYAEHMLNGSWYPKEPVPENAQEKEALDAMNVYFERKDKAILSIFLQTASYLSNLLNDMYIEEKMCALFPGSIRRGILMNRDRNVEWLPTLREMLETEKDRLSILMNLCAQYALSSRVNAWDGADYELIDTLKLLMPVIDEFQLQMLIVSSSYKKPVYSFFERRRILYDEELNTKEYYFGRHHWTKENRWIQGKLQVPLYPGYGGYMTYEKYNMGNIYGKSLYGIKNRTFRRTGFYEYAKAKRFLDPVSFFEMVRERPYLERLIKAGLYHLAEDIMDNKAQIYCEDSGDLGKALGIDRFRLKRLRTNNGGEIFLQWLLLEKAQNKLIRDDVISWMCREKLKPADLMFIMDRMAPLQIKNYLEKQAAESGESVKDLIKTWKDYLNMAIRVGVNVQDSVIYRARKLMQRHNEMIKEIEAKDLILRAGELEKKYPGLNRICRDLKKYEYADKEYQIVVPEKVDDILYEAKLMHHCVNNTETYYERMSQQESYILFLRKAEQPTEAYYTLEVEPDGTIRQTRTFYNQQNEDIELARDFLVKWQKQLKKKLAKEDYKLAVKSQSLRKKEIDELRSKGVRVNGVGYCNKLLAEILEEDLMEAGNRELEEQAA